MCFLGISSNSKTNTHEHPRTCVHRCACVLHASRTPTRLVRRVAPRLLTRVPPPPYYPLRYAQRKALYEEALKAHMAPTYALDTRMQGGKKRKDPNKPKRPPSGFLLFCTNKRMELKAQRPDLKAGPEMQAMLGEMWRNISEEEKAPYTAEYAKLKAQYVLPYHAKTRTETRNRPFSACKPRSW